MVKDLLVTCSEVVKSQINIHPLLQPKLQLHNPPLHILQRKIHPLLPTRPHHHLTLITLTHPFLTPHNIFPLRDFSMPHNQLPEIVHFFELLNYIIHFQVTKHFIHLHILLNKSKPHRFPRTHHQSPKQPHQQLLIPQPIQAPHDLECKPSSLTLLRLL